MIITDEYINELFEGTNFGEPTNNSVELKRAVIDKTLRDQIGGYWSGHTAYHIVIRGGFLIDSKSGCEKKLTALGYEFLRDRDITK